MNNYERFPQSLKDTGRFCLWKYVERKGSGELTKEPFSIYGGRARTNRTETFAPFPDAARCLERHREKYAGLGIGFFDDLVGIDIDHCAQPGGELSELAKAVTATLDSYTEYSPSGEGLHILCRAPGLAFNPARYYLKNSTIGLEVYPAGHTNRYFTVTGNSYLDEEVNERTEQVTEILERYMLRPGLSSPQGAAMEGQCDGAKDPAVDALDDAGLVERAMQAANGEKFSRLWSGDASDYINENGEVDESAADLALCNLLAFWTRKDRAQMDRLFRQSGLTREKWDELRGALTYGEMTISEAIRKCTEVWTPGFRRPENEVQKRALAFLRDVDLAHNRRYQRDDIGAGYLLADFLKPFARPVPDRKVWRVYDGSRWVSDAGGRVEEMAKDLCRALAAFAAEQEDDDLRSALLKWAGRWSSANSRKTYIREAFSVHPVSEGDFDRDPWLLNVQNGTLDLHSGVLREHSPNDLLTQLAPVVFDPTAVSPRWDRFIQEIMDPDAEEVNGGDCAEIAREKANYLQRYLGYCLTGATHEEAFCIFYGPTSRNGKSVLVRSVSAVMGDYARTVDVETVLQAARPRDGSAPSEDIARLAGARLGSLGEPPQGSRLNAARVKLLTGGDTVKARFLHEGGFEFVPQLKLILHTNHLPQCSDMSLFDSDRAAVVKFGQHFGEAERDTGLKQEFLKPENQSAILNWLLQGLREYQRRGLSRPPAVRLATLEYRRDGDKVARFMDEAMEKDCGAEERTSTVYRAFRQWCHDNGHFPESAAKFKRMLEQQGVTITRGRPKSGGENTPLVRDYRLLPDYWPTY